VLIALWSTLLVEISLTTTKYPSIYAENQTNSCAKIKKLSSRFEAFVPKYRHSLEGPLTAAHA